jgi:NTP pyrophosphatase (non-canonical NTP hydrolase)
VTDGYTDLGDVPAGLDPEAPELATGGVGVGRFTGKPYDGIELAVHHRGRTRAQANLTVVAARRLAALLTAAVGDHSQVADLVAMAEVLAVARDAAAWLDAHNGRGQHEVKLVEDVGEVAQGARIAQLGQNPRKGVTHSVDDVADELADVVITALVALQSLEVDPATVLTRKAEAIALRLERFQRGNGADDEAVD